jgi:hypothetical protein
MNGETQLQFIRTSHNITIIHITKSSFSSILYRNKCLFFIRTKVDDSIHIRPSLATSKCTEKFALSINKSQPLTTEICTDIRLENPQFLIHCYTLPILYIIVLHQNYCTLGTAISSTYLQSYPDIHDEFRKLRSSPISIASLVKQKTLWPNISITTLGIT